VEEVWAPEYEGRSAWEKNWQFFEHDGELHSVYTVQPHVVLRHDGRRAVEAGRSTPAFPWQGLALRGGAPPVRVGEEYYHFFHTLEEVGGEYIYRLGLDTFAAQPPFAVRRIVERPLLSPDEHDRPPDSNKRVVFPCGALLRGERWLVSHGCHDRECRIAVYAADEIERQLRAV
jgi:predicted GH43/DUF377 family glycosyl hydrolase